MEPADGDPPEHVETTTPAKIVVSLADGKARTIQCTSSTPTTATSTTRSLRGPRLQPRARADDAALMMPGPSTSPLHLRAALALDALEMAIWRRDAVPRDRQCAMTTFRALVSAARLNRSKGYLAVTF